MKKVINGCIYAIDLGGTEEYEFKGVHPAMVVRMLKEEKMYYVVPLTTYTKERWEKCKRQALGVESFQLILLLELIRLILLQKNKYIVDITILKN